jgi:hypothetical protein
MNIQFVSKNSTARTCRFHLFYLNHVYKIALNMELTDYLSYNETVLLDEVKKAVSSVCNGGDVEVDIAKKYTELDKVYQSEVFSDNDLLWLRCSERAIHYVWGILNKEHEKLFNDSSKRINYYNSAANPFFDKNFAVKIFAKTPVDIQKMYNQIVDYFDLYPRSNINIKNIILDILKERWGGINGNRDPFPWLDSKNENMIEWCINYIKGLDLRTGDAYADFDMMLSTFKYVPTQQKFYTPITLNEKYNAIYAFYDLWDAHQDTKKLFLLKFNKAWNQQKIRDSRKNMKSINSIVKIETKNKLDELSKHYDKKINDMLEFLIEQEHSLIKIDKLK